MIERQVIYNSVAKKQIRSDMRWRNYQDSHNSQENSPHRGFLYANQSQKSPNNTPHITRKSRVSNFWTSCLLPLLLQPGSLPSQNRLVCFRMSVPLLLRHFVSHTVLHSQRRAQKQKHSAVDQYIFSISRSTSGVMGPSLATQMCQLPASTSR